MSLQTGVIILACIYKFEYNLFGEDFIFKTLLLIFDC